ncbi:hypothetical protein GCM10011512_26050 [Tersicoccus solisilvae]|uniref:Restriction endonuclease n=1 Tax=Tersicoccus solisilvae TaxID=1882339 RepID=A0ABQ1PJ30_9MICC|nr:hypothetical protein [Tersicoccus solisilvae]GGC97887.1 hypothetical protein GCM10011512_26050 [Tersicoccus solisilvae]
MSKSDAFSDFDPVLAAQPLTDPWTHSAGQQPVYAPDYDLLGKLLTIPVAAGSASESGRFARGIDAWLAHELRRAGFSSDEVWPRAERPRVLPRDLAVLLEKLPDRVSQDLRARISNIPSVAPTDAKVLGRAYDKQVDVAVARWDRGPEILLSTKAQVSSFAKNLPNRFEEAYGDAGNLRGRYPLAAVGFFFLQRSTILTREPDAFERTVDMMRKLRDLGGSNGYTATGMALVSWDETQPSPTVRVELDRVPEDVAPPQFLAAMIRQVLVVTPVVHHVDVRERMERRNIPVPETDDVDTSDVGVRES